MVKRLPWILTGAMAVGALLLWLNLRERDQFEMGSLEPVDGAAEAAQDLERLPPLTVRHGDHEHALEVVEQRRTLTLRDRDGWYRLFWAGDEIYHYKELVHLAADLQNATAVDPTGTWRIRVKAAAAPCGTPPPVADLLYALRVSDGATDGIPALSYRCLAAHLPTVLDFTWVLAK
ncbi:MAG TPA: hypothetical protein VF950_12915 [Planctomycetota bacterium]